MKKPFWKVRYAIWKARSSLAELLYLSRKAAFFDSARELSRRYGDSEDNLTSSELRVFSQNGEDGVIAEILGRIGISERFFVEFGAQAGSEGNCIFLADVLGWKGLLIEASEEDFMRLEAKYSQNQQVRTVNEIVEPSNINRLLSESSVPHEFDVLSIDIDGNDYWIWEAIENHSPRLVVIEYNASLDPSSKKVQPYSREAVWTGSDFFGASLGALEHLGETKGYRLVHTDITGINAFFVRNDLLEGLPQRSSVPVRRANYHLGGKGFPSDPNPGRYVEPN